MDGRLGSPGPWRVAGGPEYASITGCLCSEGMEQLLCGKMKASFSVAWHGRKVREVIYAPLFD